MAGNAIKLNLPSVDELFSSQEERDDAKREKVMDLPLSEISDFANHPFKVRMDAEMQAMAESVSQYGVLVPGLVRPVEGGYEMIAGHRRKMASEMAQLETMPCIVRDLTDDEATIIMVDSNLQRENILPSEKALAYKMKLDAIRRQAGRPSQDNCAQLAPNFGKRSHDIIAEESGESKDQVRRYIRLTELIPELREMVDNEKLKQGEQHERIAFNPAVELSYLAPDLQRELFDAIQADECTPSLSQAKRLKTAAQAGKLDRNGISLVLSEEKPQQKESFTFSAEKSNKYFPSNYTPAQKQQHIEKALDYYNRYLERKRSEPTR